MHATRWDFEKPPFAGGNAEPVFYAGLPQQEALARLRFLVNNQRRLGLVLGNAGCGKSLLLTLFAEEASHAGWQAAQLNLLGLSVREFQWQLARALHANPRTGDDLPQLTRRLEGRFEQNLVQGEQLILLLDDVDQAGADVLTHITRLVQLPVSRTGQLTIVLAANATQPLRLGWRLADLVDLRIDLDPWDAEDTAAYLQLTLVAAGAAEPIFSDEALSEIHRLAAGVPRLVTRLADYSLVMGSSADVETIDVEIVTAAYEAIANR